MIVKLGDRIILVKFMIASGVLYLVSYLMASLLSFPIVGLLVSLGLLVLSEKKRKVA